MYRSEGHRAVGHGAWRFVWAVGGFWFGKLGSETCGRSIWQVDRSRRKAKTLLLFINIAEKDPKAGIRRPDQNAKADNAAPKLHIYTDRA